MSAKVLAVDCGTQSLRALIFDAEGNLLGRSRVEYEPYHSPAPRTGGTGPGNILAGPPPGLRETAIKLSGAFKGLAGNGRSGTAQYPDQC